LSLGAFEFLDSCPFIKCISLETDDAKTPHGAVNLPDDWRKSSYNSFDSQREGVTTFKTALFLPLFAVSLRTVLRLPFTYLPPTPLPRGTHRGLAPVLVRNVVEVVRDVSRPPVRLAQRAEPALPPVAEDSRGFDRLLGVDPLAVCLAREDREWTVLLRQQCGLGQEKGGEFLLLAVEQATDAVDYPGPLGMDVDCIRLALASQYVL